MDWKDTPEQAAFRAEVQEVITARLPGRYRDLAATGEVEGRAWEFDRKSPDPEVRRAATDWHQALSERGWVAPHWPKEYGGAGLTPMEQFILNQEIARAGAPNVGGSGVSLLGPTLIVHGTEQQRRRYLPPILAGEVTWAQGYSEPGSGSDLASLQTRAVRDGDDFVINGQKIWTSAAHTADAMFALVRTDPDAPKHRGISFLLIDDIKTPGISVRPLVDMNEGHYFNEVFFDNVRVPATNLVGELNRVYRGNAALWERDTDPAGFELLDGGAAAQNVVSFLRWDDSGTPIACVFNFAGQPHTGYRVGLPFAGVWDEILNTDAQNFGGSGMGNLGQVTATDEPWTGRPASALVTLPALAGVWLRLRR